MICRWGWAAALAAVGCSTAACAPAATEEVQAAPVSSPAPRKGDPLFLDGFFPIGVFSQPVESFSKWKSRGINTLLEVPPRHDPAAWDQAARQAGFRVIRRPLARPQDDIGRKDLLAWSHWDEPDAAGRIFEWTPLFERTYAEWRRIDPQRKIFINFAGPDLSWFTTRSDDYSRRYASHYPRLIATADWVANDLYPSGGWLNDAHRARRGDVTLVGEPIKILKRMTSKPQFAFIEASEIEAGNVPGARAPTSGEMRAQIWLTITLGVRGLFYFPAVVGTRGFRFDGATEELVKEMEAQNRLITRLAPVLQGPVDPDGLSVSAPAPLAVGWRRIEGGGLFILVNTSGQAMKGVEASFKGVSGRATDLVTGEATPAEGGRLKLDFQAHGVKLLLMPSL